MRRIGIIGIENSHSNHFLRHLNVEDHFPDATCTAILRGTDDRIQALTEIAPVEVLDTPEQFVGSVDAAIICSRDGALHRGQAEPLLRAGIPVLIDKPLATTTTDAQALVDLAAASGVPLLSASAVRFTPEIAELKSLISDTDELQAISVTGQADPDSEYSGLFFYGIHTVETALELLGLAAPEADLDRISLVWQPNAIIATVPISGVAVTLRFVKPDDTGVVGFHADVVGRHSFAARDLTLGPDYNLPVLKRFMDAVEAGKVTEQTDLITPVAITERLTALGTESEPVKEIL